MSEQEHIKNISWVNDDGGRSAAGFVGSARDCVVRAIAIASRIPYAQVYADLARVMGVTPRNGVRTQRIAFKRYMRGLGFRWTPTAGIGQGCTTHLRAGELPSVGRLVVSCSRHYVAVVDGVIHDTSDPSRDGTRCVYGYWS